MQLVSMRTYFASKPMVRRLDMATNAIQTVGTTVDEAAYLYTLMERSCEIQLMVEAAAANGLPKIIVDDEAAAYTFKMASDPESLYWEFQPDLEYERELSNGAFSK
jgi:ribulose-5-phosphate 4-epimerase/fuculose-1-phosphate aldolase